MQNFVFRSRRGAIAFALLTVVGALVLVGGEDGPGALVNQRDDIVSQREDFKRQMERENAAVDEPAEDDVEEIADWDDPEESDYADGEASFIPN